MSDQNSKNSEKESKASDKNAEKNAVFGEFEIKKPEAGRRVRKRSLVKKKLGHIPIDLS
jgi:hypothetical protein